jgi:hypothetical protein
VRGLRTPPPAVTRLQMTGLPGTLRVLAVAFLVACGEPTTDWLWLFMRVISSAFVVTLLAMYLQAVQPYLLYPVYGGRPDRVLHHDRRPGRTS